MQESLAEISDQDPRQSLGGSESGNQTRDHGQRLYAKIDQADEPSNLMPSALIAVYCGTGSKPHKKHAKHVMQTKTGTGKYAYAEGAIWNHELAKLFIPSRSHQSPPAAFPAAVPTHTPPVRQPE